MQQCIEEARFSEFVYFLIYFFFFFLFSFILFHSLAANLLYLTERNQERFCYIVLTQTNAMQSPSMRFLTFQIGLALQEKINTNFA